MYQPECNQGFNTKNISPHLLGKKKQNKTHVMKQHFSNEEGVVCSSHWPREAQKNIPHLQSASYVFVLGAL